MATDDSALAATVRRYFAALERADPEGNLAFFTPNVLQEEFPNRLVPNGATRNFEQLREATYKSSKLAVDPRYEVLNVIASGNRAAVEAVWSATLTVPIGSHGARAALSS